jgi:hypothetical protein
MTITRIFAIIRKEVIQISRDPRTLAVAFLIPVMLLCLLCYAATKVEQHVEKIEPSVQLARPTEIASPKAPNEPAKLTWTPEAEKLFSQVPSFLKERARKAIEETALERGVTEITPELILEVRKKNLGF